MIQTSFGGLGEENHIQEINKKQLSNWKTVAITVDHKYIFIDNHEDEILQSGTDWSFRYCYTNPDDFSQQRIVLHANGNIDYSIQSGLDADQIRYTYNPNWSEPNDKNYEIYRNLLNFLYKKRQACTAELDEALKLRDVKRDKLPEDVTFLRGKLLEK